MRVTISSLTNLRCLNKLPARLADPRQRAVDQIDRRIGSGQNLQQLQNPPNRLHVLCARRRNIARRGRLGRRRGLAK